MAKAIKYIEDHDNNNSNISIEQYNQEIDEAVLRVEAGEFYTGDEVEQLSKEW